MRQLFESQPDFFKFEVLNSKWLVAAVTVENGGTWWEKKKSSLGKARKRCHKRIFGIEIIISRVLRYKTS